MDEYNNIDAEYQRGCITEAEKLFKLKDYQGAFRNYVIGKCPIGLLKLYKALEDETGKIETSIRKSIDYLLDDKSDKVVPLPTENDTTKK